MAAAVPVADCLPRSGDFQPAEDQQAIADLIKANDRLGLNIRWAADLRADIERVYAAGRSTGFLPADPAPSSVYQGN